MTKGAYRCIDAYMPLKKEEMRKVSINFSKDLWTKLKIRAAEEDTTVTEILMRLSRDYFAKGKKKGGR